MWSHNDIVSGGLAAALPQVTDQFFARFELCPRGLVAIEIAHQTDAERDVVQVIAVDMAAVDLAAPTVSDFDLAVAGRCPVANHEVISKPILHSPHMSMIIIEYPRIALARATVMHDNKLPAAPLDRRSADLFDYRSREIAITFARPRPRPKTKCARWRRWRRLKALLFFEAGFFDYDLGSLAGRNGSRNFWLRRCRRSRHGNRMRWRRSQTFRWNARLFGSGRGTFLRLWRFACF
jgi:hypothetical protein